MLVRLHEVIVGETEVNDSPRRSLPMLQANARRLRSIYAWVALTGLVGSGLLGAYVASGAEISGPLVAVAVVSVGSLFMGAGMLLARRSADAKIVRVLLEEPHRVARVIPKETESTMQGATVARYQWIVVELVDRSRLDVYASSDFDRVLAEVRRCAPDAHYHQAWIRERTNVRFR